MKADDVPSAVERRRDISRHRELGGEKKYKGYIQIEWKMVSTFWRWWEEATFFGVFQMMESLRRKRPGWFATEEEEVGNEEEQFQNQANNHISNNRNR